MGGRGTDPGTSFQSGKPELAPLPTTLQNSCEQVAKLFEFLPESSPNI
jgi:hypothetical protein